MHFPGAVPFHYFSAATTNSNLVLGRRCVLDAVVCINTTAVIYYLKVYDKLTAPVVGTDPVAFTIPIPGAAGGAGVVVPFPRGVQILTGLGFGLTAALADADTTVAATGVSMDFFVR